MSEDKRHLYPGVIAAGGIQPALRNALAAIGSPLTVYDLNRIRFSLGARVVSGRRFAQVYMAFEEPLFVFELWNGEFVKAHGQTPNLAEVARTFRRWVDTNLTAADIASEFDFILAIPEPSPNDGVEDLERRWREYISKLDTRCWTLISPTHLVAHEREPTRMVALTNFSWLGEMGPTGYPSVFPGREGRYSVICHNCKDSGIRNAKTATEQSAAIFKGYFLEIRDADTTARLVVNHLPGHCVTAEPGTEEVIPLRVAND